METWKPIEGYEGLYEISDQGRVRRIAVFKRAPKPPYVLKPQRHNQGYLIVALHKGAIDGVRQQKCQLVHRLVASAFLGKSDLTINHKNGDKKDNRLENLEYVSLQENAAHSISAGLNPAYNARRSTPEMVRKIHDLRKLGMSQQAIGDKVGFCQVHISHILRTKVPL